jgi:hypothetical protein
MENINIAATGRTPALSLDLTDRVFLLEGESYPEDTKKFYEAPITQVQEFLAQSHVGPVTCQFKLKYFNSSSAKVLMDLFTSIESSAEAGNVISVEWHHIADDDNMQELGEEFSEELNAAQFKLVPF